MTQDLRLGWDMNAIRSDRGVDAVNAQAPPPVQTQLPAEAMDAVELESAQRQVKPFSAVFWIIAAWLIGTLVSELNVIGAESRPVDIIEISVDHQSADLR